MRIDDQVFLDMTAALDAEQFWAENVQCLVFSPEKPRCPISFSPDDHWLFEFLQVPSTVRYYNDKPYRDDLHRQANATTQASVGKTFFDEDTWRFQPKRIEQLFGCELSIKEGGTPWLVPATNDRREFEVLLDNVESVDVRAWCFPDDFLDEWERRKRQGRPLLTLGTGSRGPATIMTSVLKPETAIIWMYDFPDLMRRFRDMLAAKMVELNLALRDFSGNQQKGWWITDDNSALFNRKLYREFCYPVLETVLDTLAPGDARRYQHSDSAMGHLMDYQYDLGIRAVNYGPEVDAGDIRAVMPDAWIHGQMPPLLLRNGSPDEIRERMVQDFEKAGESGGLVLTTAGSLAAGTGVGRMRWFMLVVQEHCRYDAQVK